MGRGSPPHLSHSIDSGFSMLTTIFILLCPIVASLTVQSKSGKTYLGQTDLEGEKNASEYDVQSARLENDGDKPKEAKKEFANLCVDGHIAPELILFGPARASTSTFSQNFAQSESVVYGKCNHLDNPGCTPYGIKEMHFFRDWDGKTGSKTSYLSHYPECTSEKRIVAADFTPGQHVPASACLPKIAQFYGNLLHQVKFVMLIREPVHCMQSFFHFEYQEKTRSFQSYVESVLKAPEAPFFRYLNNVLIADSLKMFLFDSPFKGSQLTIVPMQYNEDAKNGFKRATSQFWEDLDIKGEKGTPEIERANYNDRHTSVEEDLTQSTLIKLHELLEEKTGAGIIAQILQNATKMDNAPRLYGFTGDASNATAVKEWIESGW